MQRKEFLEKTLYINKNLKEEVKDNMDKMNRKLDNIFFEDLNSGTYADKRRTNQQLTTIGLHLRKYILNK